MQLEITTLGRCAVTLNQKEIDIRSKKAVALLCYLAVAAQPVPRQTVIGLLWPESTEATARSNLRTQLTTLRRALGETALSITRTSVGIEPTVEIKLDLAALQSTAASQSKDAERDEAVSALYQGDFLAGLTILNAPLFEQWVQQIDQECRTAAVKILRRLATAGGRDGRPIASAIPHARRWVELEPYDEEGVRTLLAVLNKAGHRSAALASYDRFRTQLGEELGLEPALETKRLILEIQNGAPALSGQPTAEEPPEVQHRPPLVNTRFIGRDTELEKMITILNRPEGGLVTLCGTGGVGKSRLSLEVGHRLVDQFQHGVAFSSLVSLADPALIADRLLTDLGVRSGGNRPTLDQLIDYLRPKGMLLILDNFEHLLEGADLVQRLLQEAPALKILVTSREPLGIREEAVLPLTGLSYRPDSAKRGDHTSEAVQLFIDRAGRFDLSFNAGLEAEGIERICRLVEGMPLAVELAATWVRSMPCAEIGNQIEKNLDILRIDAAGLALAAHHNSMRAVFRTSWDLLSDAAAAGFAALSIFQGSFTADAATTVTGISLRTLITLVDKGFVHKEVPDRYRIHPLLRQFGEEQRHILPDLSPLNDAYGRYYIDLWLTQRDGMYGAGDLDLLHLIDREIDHLRALWQRLVRDPGRAEWMLELLPITAYFYQRRSRFHEGLTLFTTVLEAVGRWEIGPELRGQIEIEVGAFAFQLGQYDRSEEILNVGIARLQRADVLDGAPRGYFFLGMIALRRGEYAAADRYYGTMRDLCQTTNNRKEIPLAHIGMGISAATQGMYQEAADRYTAALDIYHENRFQRGIASTLNNLGSVFGRQGFYPEALERYKKARAASVGVEEEMLTATILSNLGSVSRSLERYEAALNYYRESLALTRRLGEQRWIAANLNGIGLTYFEQGAYPQAVNALLDGLKTAGSIEAKPDMLTAITQLGRVGIALGALEEAAGWLIFVANHSVTPELSRREAAEALTGLEQQLAPDARERAKAAANGWTIDHLEATIEAVCKRNFTHE